MDTGEEGIGNDMSQPHPVTFGHGTAGRAEPAEPPRAAGATSVADVAAPGSRRAPEPPRDRPARWMSEEGRAHRWERRPGGFREQAPGSPGVARRNASFRTCAGHTRSPEFVAALDELPTQVPDERTAVMCGGAAGWRRHRLAQDDEAPASERS